MVVCGVPAAVYRLGDRDSAGDGGLVLRAELAQLCRRQALRILVQEKQAHYMGSLQAEFRHLRIFDPLDIFIAYCNAGEKVLKPVGHDFSLFSAVWWV